MPVRVAIVGQRGVGKSSLLERIVRYAASDDRIIKAIDLDREIEARSGKSITEIFDFDGEPRFRQMETELFDEVDETTRHSKYDVYVAFGGGFDPGRIPLDWNVVWVRRVTDAHGRVFMDRPRLDQDISPIEEFKTRAAARELRFQKRADRVLWIDEGLEHEDQAEKCYWLSDVTNMGGAITVLPTHFKHRFSEWVAERVRWGLEWFELRDDLLDKSQLAAAIDIIPNEKVLISFRDRSREGSTYDLVLSEKLNFDWPFERGSCPFDLPPRFLSLHDRHLGDSLKETLNRFPFGLPAGTQLKAALAVDSFKELEEGHRWMEQQPDKRVFLPMSKDGRWSWYRLWLGDRPTLNFIREGKGTGPDQPMILPWIRRRLLRAKNVVENASNFAAVLGDPVTHSRSPMEHVEFFSPKGIPFLSVRLTEEEWRDGALEFLHSLGLSYAAVTSPLKKIAFESAAQKTETAVEVEAANTLMWTAQGWSATNTDLSGFVKLSEAFGDLGKIAVWGGGGTLGVIHKVLPQSEFFSSRSKENRDANRVRAFDFYPDTVIWAIGRNDDGSFAMPPDNWWPKQIIDLNYAEASPGREYALIVKAQYISGLEMFKAQAQAQREFWQSEK